MMYLYGFRLLLVSFETEDVMVLRRWFCTLEGASGWMRIGAECRSFNEPASLTTGAYEWV